MHPAVRDFVARHAPSISADMLEIGAVDINGGVRDLFHPGCRWTGLDLAAGPYVDIVADAATWDPPRRYDVVVCTEVLEHAEQWRGIVATCGRALRDGGLLLLTCAGPGRAPYGQHGDTLPAPGEWYGNVHPDDLADEVAEWAAPGWIVEQVGEDVQVRAWRALRGD